MEPKFRLRTAAILVLLFAFAPSVVNAEGEEQGLKIGFVLPLSGEWAFLGNGIRDGALLAAQDLQAKGPEVALVFEDNHGDLSASAVVASKLINVEKVDALVSIISGVSKLLKPLAASAQVLNIGICSDTEVADGRFSFINYVTAEQGAAKFISHFRRTAGTGASIGIFTLNEAGFLKIVDEVRRQSAGDPQLAFVETFDKGNTDFRSLLLRAVKVNPSALMVLGLSPEIEVLVKQARTMAIRLPVTSIEGFGLASDKTPFEGSWFIDSGVPNAAFRERFKKVYGREVTPGVGHSYDSVMLIAKAAEVSNKKPGKARAEWIERFRKIDDFQGALGPLRVRPDGVIWSEASIKTIKNGEPVILESGGDGER